MNQKYAFRIFSYITVISLLFALMHQNVLAQGTPQIDLDIDYSDRGREVVEVQVSNEVVIPDVTISADVKVIARSAPTYGLSFSVEHGTISGPAIDRFLNVTNVSIPFVGKRTLDIGRVTFSPDSHLKIRLNKFGVFD